MNFVREEFTDFCFSLNDCSNDNETKLGLNECLKHGHLQPYPVLIEKSKSAVAQFKWTVAVSNKRILLLAGH